MIPEDSLARTMEQAELTPLRAHNPDISRRLAKAIEKGLEVHPDDRYENAEAFKRALYEASNTIRKQAENVVLEPVGASERKSLPLEEEKSSKRDSSGPIRVSRPIGELDFEPPPKPKPSRSRGIFVSFILLLLFLVAGAGLLYYFQPDLVEQVLGFAPAEFALPLPTSTETDTSQVTPEESPGTLTEAAALVGVATLTPAPATQTLVPPANTEEPTSTQTPTDTLEPTETPSPTATFTPTVYLSPTITPLGGGYGQIAFASDRSGTPQIWVINSNGSGLHQITEIQMGACQPAWSPDGQRLAFISPCDENELEYDASSLYLVNADGSDLTALPTTGRGDYDPTWSPDSEALVFTSLRMGYRPQIYLMDLASQEVQRLSTEDHRDFHPQFSPDGSKIVFITSRNGPYQIWTMNADGSEPKRFSASGSLHDLYPVWSHDGNTIIFTQKEINGIPYLMGARYPDGGPAEFKVYPFPGSIPMREADYSPDDLWLAFESWPEGPQHDIYLMRMNAGDLTPLTTDPAFEFDPSWRPIDQ
jgi:Tol biopolymer transport system component